MTGSEFWSAPRIWPGETCFIVGGGPSVQDVDLDRLRGRKVIVLNVSYRVCPWADVLFFGDTRIWNEHRPEIEKFGGLIVTASALARAKHIKRMRKTKPPGLAPNPFEVIMHRTSFAAAINLAVHFGCARIVLIGCDGGPDKNGRTHHHKPHPWPQKAGCWAEQRADLLSLVKPLRKRGVEVVNCSPRSTHDFWPRMSLADYLDTECRPPASCSDTNANPATSGGDAKPPAFASADRPPSDQPAATCC